MTTFGILPLGGGGYVTGIDIASDGTAVTRANTGGAWVSSNLSATPAWTQILTSNSLPASAVNILSGLTGVNEIMIAKSATSNLYMKFKGFMLTSSNRGATWTDTGYTQDSSDPNNPNSGSMGPLIAVDPANKDIVFTAAPNVSMFKTANGTHTPTATWTAISTSSVPASSSFTVVAFDPSSSVSGGATQGIYAGVYGSGVYHSTDGGTTWALAAASGPTSPVTMTIDQFGVVWIADSSATIWRLLSGTWTHMTALNVNEPYGSAVTDPASGSQATSHVFAIHYDGRVNVSTDGGANWSGLSLGPTGTSTDIPWLAAAIGGYLNSGGKGIFDPALTGKLWVGGGVGVFSTTPPTASVTSTVVNWTSATAPQETLVSNVAVVPPGGAPNIFSWDREAFKTAIGTSYPPQMGYPTIGFIMGGWAADWVAGSSFSPAKMAMLVVSNVGAPPWLDLSGVSTDGGVTWVPFGSTSSTSHSIGSGSLTWTVDAGLSLTAGDSIQIIRASDASKYMGGTVTSYSGTTLVTDMTYYLNASFGAGPFTDWIIHSIPSATINSNSGGCIAAASDTNFIWLPTFDSTYVYKTTDGGKNWTKVTIAGIPTSWVTNTQSQTLPVGATVNITNIGTGLVFPTGNVITMGQGDGVTLINYIQGTVASYNPGTGALSITVTSQQGSGTISNWTVRQTTGWGPFAANKATKLCTADRVDANTFYLYNYLIPGVYKSTDGGATWAKVYSSSLGGSAAYGGVLKSVPGKAGHLFYCDIIGGTPKRSTDHGATWTVVKDGSTDFSNTTAFGFGATFPGQSYPAIYIAGFNGTNTVPTNYGIWRSIDNAVTWTKLTDFPNGVVQIVNDLDGDKTTPGTIYGATSGAGAWYGFDAVSVTVPTIGFPVIHDHGKRHVKMIGY